jgi:sulfate permease, SulP family
VSPEKPLIRRWGDRHVSGHESVTILPGALTASPAAPPTRHGVHSWRIGAFPRRRVDQKGLTARLGLQDLFAGITCSVLSVAYCLSFATLIFSGPLSGLLGYGIAIGLLSASIGALVIGIRSTLPIVIAGPDSPTSAVLAVLVANFVHRLVAEATIDDVVKPAIVLMSLVTALTGAVLLLLGLTRAGRAIRFIPYPVIGGFLGATGWLIAVGGVQVTAGEHVTIDSASSLLNSSTSGKLLAALIVAAALLLARRWLRSALVVPAVLLIGVVGVHLTLLSLGIPLAEAQASGWMFGPQLNVVLAPPWDGDDLRRFPWEMLPSLAGDILSVVFVVAITLLLNTTGVELATRREADLDQELKSHGIANLIIATLGGYISVTSLSRTTINYLAGATGRLSAMTVAAILAAVIAVDSSFLGYVPKCVLGGLLFYLGADLLYRWLVDSSRRLALLEYLSLLGIAFIIIKWGFVAGLLIGVVIGCATFAFSASRIPVIKFSFDGSEYRSSLDRGPEELTVLAEYGDELQGMSLQGYLFFGSASRLHAHVKGLLAARPRCRFIVFDLRLVTGTDSSATNSFKQIKQVADGCGTQLALVNMTRELVSAFRTTGVISDDVLVVSDLDHALEQCENAIIAAHQTSGSEAKSLLAWLTQMVGAEHAHDLAKECQRLEVSAGEIIVRQGDAADSMHFILDGRVSVVVNGGNRPKVRVRSLGPHTMIGEMGLIAGQDRSATIEAEVPSVLYVLKADAFERVRATNPALFQALLAYVVTVMAERLSFANRAIEALQR